MRIPPVLLLFPILFYCMCLSNHVFAVSSFCLEDQRSLLLQLKDNLKFNSASSGKLVSWNQSLPCCHWIGVTCDGEGHVTGLDLSGESISGGFDNSSALFGLQYLQNLNLANNNFNSVIPSEIKKLKKLTSLNLSYAYFVGQIPIEISQLSRLVTLDISCFPSYLTEQELKLENPNLQKLVQNLTSITQLYLDGVSISAQGKEWCSALLSLPLQELSMSSCNLSGPIDSSLEVLKNLSIIRLNQNNLSASVLEFFAKFSNLTALDLSYCGLSGRFPKEIFQIQTLSSLDISYNSGLQGSLPDFPQNGSLQTLNLSRTNFSGALPDSISNLRQLSRLEISECQLNGTLPVSISNLTELSHLDLSYNYFSGSIPFFGMAKKLTLIDLSHNDLSGGISSAHLEGLVKLVSIDLHDNFLNGIIPSTLFALPLLQIIQLSNNHFQGQMNGISNVSYSMLETLDLSSNNLEGPIPEFIFRLRRLIILQLSSNKFNGTIKIGMIWRLENLNTLDLSHNNLSIDANVKDDHISSFPRSMTNVNLASCKLRGFPGFLRNQSRLTNLDLSNNQIPGRIPSWIWQLEYPAQLNLSHNFLMEIERSPHNLSYNLFSLDLHDNSLQGSLPAFPVNALYLDYSFNNFISVIPPDIDNYLSFTIFLSLSHNFLRDRIPDSICNASYLQVLDLSFNNFDGMIPHCLSKSGTLGVLNLRKNHLSGNIPDTFQASCALKTLDLNGNNLHGPVPKSLSNCTTLEVLDLGNNKIDDQFPCLLKNLSTLRVLVLRKNNFHGLVGCPKTKGIWKMLQIVDLAFNKFSGPLPGKWFTTWKAMMMPDEDQAASELNHLHFDFFKYGQLYYKDQVTITIKGQQMTLNKILTVFTSIDFSSNHIEGPIPEEMMDFRALHGLNLSNNALSGQIPSSIGNLKQLESLDLSKNSLTGQIPTQLASLSFLSFMNLSFNHLVGRIPTGTQIQSFEASSFQGNDGLYGPPLTKSPYHGEQGLLPPLPLPAFKNHHAIDLNMITGAELGVVFGFGVIIGLLLYRKKWRIWYWKRVDSILCSIFPQMQLEYQRHEGQTYTVLRWRN